MCILLLLTAGGLYVYHYTAVRGLYCEIKLPFLLQTVRIKIFLIPLTFSFVLTCYLGFTHHTCSLQKWD